MIDDRAEALHAIVSRAVQRWITVGDVKAEKHLREVLHALSALPAGERRQPRRTAWRRKRRAA